jgi:hypothetical protein
MHNTENSEFRAESSYYTEICAVLQENISRVLAPLGEYDVRFQVCGTKDMLWGLQKIYNSLTQAEYIPNQRDQFTQDLFVDVIGSANPKGEIRRSTRIICEVKIKTLTLNDYAQLLGYCVTANVEHGLLISVDHGISSKFDNNLRRNENLKSIERPNITHKFGILKFRTKGREIEFNEIAYYKSWYVLARTLIRSMNKIV